ncbi:hypothetical protein NKR23_g3686 [Pleurostoma richardsiae]|uniref:MARVEL domain-containing protein n=1 Tax=Pleurostoma richardsiae TaxID=41990 RepID=A0AA38RXY1_9PEZI|nr:hypothetical protein NKR23_g3686 [Pleurostoma richardsiae]
MAVSLSLVAIVTRAFQIIFGAVILGISVTLIKAQVYGDAPVTTKYSAFCGAFAIFVGLTGLLLLFVESIPFVIALGIDALGTVLLLAAGIAWAVGLRGVNCNLGSHDDERWVNLFKCSLINEGRKGDNVGVGFGKSTGEAFNAVKANCQRARVGEVFCFLSVGFLLALLFLSWVLTRKRRGGSRYVA